VSAPDEDVALGIAFVVILFSLSIAWGWFIVAVLTGLILVLIILASIPA
jgi:hypothetical protein